MSRKIKNNGTMQNIVLEKAKKYKYDATGNLIESIGTPGDNEIEISGSKSSLRRVADIERNVSVLATSMLTTDNDQGFESPAQVKALASTDATTKADAALASALAADTDTIYDSTAIDAAVALNTAKVTNSTNATDLVSGTLQDSLFPVVLPAISGANLTDLPTSSGGSGGTADFVASGTLPNGTPVILKADGTVEAVGITSITVVGPMSIEPEVVFNAGNTSYMSMAFDPNTVGKFIIAYSDNSYVGTAIVGTVSGTSISFGTEVVFNASNTIHMSLSFDPNTAGKFIVAYGDNSGYGTAIVGTVSGTSISFGTAVVFNSGNSYYNSISFDPNMADKFVIAYRDAGNASYGTAIAGTVYGTSISFGTEVVFNNSGTTNYISMAFDLNNAGKFVIAYQDGGNSNYGNAIVGTVSGTSISFGTAVVFNAGNTSYMSMAFDPNMADKFVISYQDGGNSNYGTAIVGTVSGTSITGFGTAIVFNAGFSYYNTISFDPNMADKCVISYMDRGNSDYGTAIVGTISGTSISFGTEVVFNAGSISHMSLSFDPNMADKFVIAYRDDGNSSYGTAVLCEMEELAVITNLTADNFMGLSTAAYTDAETATVTLQGGISTNQTDLTIGSDYYVQEDGTLATTAATPSVIAGKALSATSLFLSPSVYDSTAIDAAVALNTAKVSNVDHPLVETAVPVGAVFTDTDTVYTLPVDIATEGYVNTQVAALVDSSPATLDTLNELAAALGDDPNFATTMTNTLAGKVDDGQVLTNVPAGALFTDTDTIYDSTAIDAAVALNTAKVSNSTSATDLTSGTLQDSLFPVVLPAISGANLTDLPASAGGTADFVASGILPNGAPVILKADGTVEVVEIASTDTHVITPNADSIRITGNDYLWEASAARVPVLKFDPNGTGTFIIAYGDNSGGVVGGHAVVGTVSGTTITFGTVYQFNTTAFDDDTLVSIDFDPHNAGKFIIAYNDVGNNNYGTTRIGTISGTTLTFGNEYVFSSGTTDIKYISVAHDPITVDRLLYVSRESNGVCHARIGTINGTIITFGSQSDWANGGSHSYMAFAFNPNMVDKVVIVMQDNDGNKGKARIATLNATTVSFSSAYQFSTFSTLGLSIVFDPNQTDKFVVSYINFSKPAAIVGTMTASSITFGTQVEAPNNSYNLGPMSSINAYGKFIIAFNWWDGSYSNNISIVGTVSGDTITFAPYYLINQTTSGWYSAATFDPNDSGNFVIIRKEGVTYQAKIATGTINDTVTTTEIATNLTSSNFMGISTAAYTDAETATVMLQGGISTNQTGLTIGTDYYVQEDGTLATTADTINVFAGKAVSATSLFLSSPVYDSTTIDAAVALNTAKVSNSTDATDLVSGTLQDSLFPVVLPAISGANLTDLPASAGGTADFVASGTLPNGTPLILKADGTVEAIGITSSIVVGPMSTTGAEVVFNWGTSQYTTIEFDPNTPNKFVIAYQDVGNSQYGTAIVGTVSGTTLSFGAEYVFNSSSTNTIVISFDPNTPGKFVIAYRDQDNSAYGTAIVGTVSGTTLSFGTSVVFNATSYFITVSFDPNTAGKFIVAYRDSDTYGKAIVGTVSGTTMTFGTEKMFNYGSTFDISMDFDPNTVGKFVIVYRDDGNSDYGTAIVGTVSGTSISFGTEVVFNSGNTSYTSMAFNPNTAGKFVITYANYGTAIVGTVSGTSISFGTAVVFNSGTTSYISMAFSPNTADKFVITYRDSDTYGKAIVGTVSGDIISFGNEVVFNTGVTYYISIAFDPNSAGTFVIPYSYNSQYGKAVIGEIEELAIISNLTADNFIGTSTAAYTDAETATVMLQGGVSTNQTGLVVNSTYYVQADGTLDTAADTISVIAGKAIGTTRLLLKGI